jgi:hypothetical protein
MSAVTSRAGYRVILDFLKIGAMRYGLAGIANGGLTK